MKLDTRALSVVAPLALYVALANQAVAADFDYLDVGTNAAVSTHQAGYTLQVDGAFKLLGEFHHQQRTGELLFNVSMAAYANGGDIIMVHAETLADPTGVLDYNHLPQTALNGLPFGLREQCVPAAAEADIAANPQAQFVRGKGFELTLPFLLTQFLQASPDGNAEFVVSYGQAVDSCETILGPLRTEIRTKVERSLTVTKTP